MSDMAFDAQTAARDSGSWQWFWTADWTAEDEALPRLVCFRREFFVTGLPQTLGLRVFADSRYKLYLNGELVNEGPQKGYGSTRFYDTLEVASHLREGANVIGLVVLRYPKEGKAGNHSLLRLAAPVAALDADDSTLLDPVLWQSYVFRGCALLPEEARFSPLVIHERVRGDERLLGWQQPGFVPEGWSPVRVLDRRTVEDLLQTVSLQPRQIPLMRRRAGGFAGITQILEGAHTQQDWEAFLQGNAPIQIPPHTTEVVELSAGEEMTAFLKLSLWGGTDAEIRLRYAEAYVQKLVQVNEIDWIWTRGDRTDFREGHLEGYEDVYQAVGTGTETKPELYEPFWFRTFRFLRLTVKTGDAPLYLGTLNVLETGYPLQAKTAVSTSDPTHAGIWEISLRTLQRCMHDTYMDCPYYEQLQYIMDARTEILYTYAVSGDDRLARACMEAFRSAQTADGMINCSYPNCTENLIVGFPIYYILMLHDHMMYFGDKDFLRRHLEAVDRLLGFYHRHLDPRGILGKIGTANLKSRYWSFIDWAEMWNDTTGMPTAGLSGPITMESLLYLLGLQRAAELAAWLGEQARSDAYQVRAKRVQDAIRQLCVSEDGMVQDGPGIPQYSQHSQVFAILTQTIPAEQGKQNLLKTIKEPERYAQCTVAMRYYLFRALEMTDLYAWTDRYWETWRTMLRNHATTCIEGEAYCRSECHAWGSLILYELPAAVLGVRPAAPGFAAVRIKPVPGYLTEASGIVETPKGPISVSWSIQAGKVNLTHEVPAGMTVETL